MRRAIIAALLACALPVSAEEAQIIASGAGSFAGGENLSVEAAADQVAALEQQAFRETRWEVVEDAVIALAFDVSPSGAATAQLLVSADGVRFTPLPFGGTAQAGQVMSLFLSQATTETDGRVSFQASDWSFELIARPNAPREGTTFGPILLPLTVGRALGCASPGCGDDVTDTDVAPIGGTPNAEPGTAPAATAEPSSSEGNGDLARELQTQLARVGCYSIAIDGLWGPGSRRAVAAFNAATGLDLPGQTPSARTLVEVAQRQDQVCSE